jgi:predicted TIM-barrel fold metal-dependent hydrolase
MTDHEGARTVGPVIQNLDKVLDAHTHLSGSESGENSENILDCMDACGVEKAFIFAPELAGGDLGRAVDLMIEEANRCYHELGLRGVGEVVPAHWYANDPQVLRLWEALAELGMYVAFHCGIFFDGRESSYCRPTFFEAVHQAPNFKGHLAHVGWPWVDECIAVLKIGARFLRIDPAEWGLKVDLSFGPPGDWQLETWQRVLNNLPLDMPCYASDVFWPCEPEEYREKYLQPQLGLFETATTLEHIVEEGDLRREQLRNKIFFENAYSHWQAAVHEPQNPRPAPEPVQTPRARWEPASV